jgi:hypothetical protein
MIEFEIMLDDLKPPVQTAYLTLLGVEKPSDINAEVIPIAIIELEDD